MIPKYKIASLLPLLAIALLSNWLSFGCSEEKKPADAADDDSGKDTGIVEDDTGSRCYDVFDCPDGFFCNDDKVCQANEKPDSDDDDNDFDADASDRDEPNDNVDDGDGAWWDIYEGKEGDPFNGAHSVDDYPDKIQEENQKRKDKLIDGEIAVDLTDWYKTDIRVQSNYLYWVTWEEERDKYPDPHANAAIMELDIQDFSSKVIWKWGGPTGFATRVENYLITNFQEAITKNFERIILFDRNRPDELPQPLDFQVQYYVDFINGGDGIFVIKGFGSEESEGILGLYSLSVSGISNGFNLINSSVRFQDLQRLQIHQVYDGWIFANDSNHFYLAPYDDRHNTNNIRSIENEYKVAVNSNKAEWGNDFAVDKYRMVFLDYRNAEECKTIDDCIPGTGMYKNWQVDLYLLEFPATGTLLSKDYKEYSISESYEQEIGRQVFPNYPSIKGDWIAYIDKTPYLQEYENKSYPIADTRGDLVLYHIPSNKTIMVPTPDSACDITFLFDDYVCWSDGRFIKSWESQSKYYWEDNDEWHNHNSIICRELPKIE